MCSFTGASTKAAGMLFETTGSRGGFKYRQGDRVMQILNNYDKDVFNGDIGTIENVDMEDRSLKVRFEERLVEYEDSELDELTLAYATTIHKS